MTNAGRCEERLRDHWPRMNSWGQALQRGVEVVFCAWHPVKVAGTALAAAMILSASLCDASATAGQPAAGPAAPTAVVTVRPIALGRPNPVGFVGLSLEYRTVLSYSGTDPRAINPVFVRLLQNLVPDQSPVLRIGGDSTDWTWWPVPKMLRPLGVTYDITPRWLAVARALAQATRARYILGINLEANSDPIEAAEARALLSGIGRRYVASLELGNEPELYPKLGWYKTANGVFVPGRPTSYDFHDYSNEFSSFEKAMSPVPVDGPSSGSYLWLTHLPQFLAAAGSLGDVTVHSYWLNACLRSPRLLGYPSVPHLLRPDPPSRLARGLKRYAVLAHADHVPIRIDEMNSVTCRGKHGVSDVFASALWALNALFQAMSDGVDGVNIHTFPGTANQLFGFSHVKGRWVATVRPEYYGLLMFAQAAPPGTKLMRVIQIATGQTRAWATIGTNGYVRVVLINDSLTRSSSVLVRTPSPAGRPTLERLLAPSAEAAEGITIDGQSFGAQTATGALTGPSSTVTLQSSASAGAITSNVVTLPAASAAMLTIPSRRLPYTFRGSVSGVLNSAFGDILPG